MQLQAKQTVYLVTAEKRPIGQIVIERSEEDCFFGSFTPRSAFSVVQPLFRDFEEAVNLQALSVVDELDNAIRALGLHIRLADDSQHVAVDDVQIWSDGRISFRVDSPTPSRAGPPAARTAAGD
jgi:hypothetical protein